MKRLLVLSAFFLAVFTFAEDLIKELPGYVPSQPEKVVRIIGWVAESGHLKSVGGTAGRLKPEQRTRFYREVENWAEKRGTEQELRSIIEKYESKPAPNAGAAPDKREVKTPLNDSEQAQRQFAAYKPQTQSGQTYFKQLRFNPSTFARAQREIIGRLLYVAENQTPRFKGKDPKGNIQMAQKCVEMWAERYLEKRVKDADLAEKNFSEVLRGRCKSCELEGENDRDHETYTRYLTGLQKMLEMSPEDLKQACLDILEGKPMRLFEVPQE